MFCEKKKSKCPKKNFQSVKKGEKKKNVSVEFRVFGKKRKLKEKFREKKSKCFFWMKILLSSCSLVGFFCGKEMFLKFEEKVLGVCYPVSWAPC